MNASFSTDWVPSHQEGSSPTTVWILPFPVRSSLSTAWKYSFTEASFTLGTSCLVFHLRALMPTLSSGLLQSEPSAIKRTGGSNHFFIWAISFSAKLSSPRSEEHTSELQS